MKRIFLIAGVLIFVATAYLWSMPPGSDTPVADSLSSARSADGSYISWREHILDGESTSGITLRGADGFESADFDRDGNLDVAVMWEDSAHLRLTLGHEQADQWQSITLAEGLEVKEIEDGAVGDLNGDGWLDLLVATEGGSLLYLQNPGERLRDSEWPRVVPKVVENRGSWIRVYLADLNGDGRLEAVAVNKGVTMPSGKGSMDVEATPVSWFSIGDSPLSPDAWVEHELNRTVVPVNAHPVDLDGDGDLDIVGGSRGEARMFWFENLTQSVDAPITFREHEISVSGRHVPAGIKFPKMLSGMDMVFGDLNGDGRLDIVTNETAFSLNWLEQPADLSQPWQIHTIGALYPDVPTGLLLADINGDGLDDVFTGGYSEDPRDLDSPLRDRNSRAGRLVWFEQTATSGGGWIEHNVSRRVRGMYDAFALMDMDQDGLMDILYTRGNSGEFDGLYWMQQQRNETAVRVFTPAYDKESQALPLPDSLLSKIANWILD